MTREETAAQNIAHRTALEYKHALDSIVGLVELGFTVSDAAEFVESTAAQLPWPLPLVTIRRRLRPDASSNGNGAAPEPKAQRRRER